MAASLGPGWHHWAQRRQSSTHHARKISIALINIPLGNYCLVRQHGNASNFFRASSNFFREDFESFCAPITAATRRNTKYTAKHGECAERTACKARCESYSRKRRVKSIFTLPHECNGQSVVWSRVADSVA